MADTETKPTAATAGAATTEAAPVTAETPTIEPELAPASEPAAAPDNDDADSALGDDAASSTASLNSSIFEYRRVNGRTYHKEMGNAAYWGTNDEGHNESLDVLHHLFTLCLDGKLYEAPISNPKKVLDIGTGTGIWAIDVADQHPESEVIGTDVSPIQPTWVPPNLKFELEDCTQEWTFPPNTFDLVHIRYLLGCIVDWTAFFKEAFQVVRPGGYLESYEASPVVKSDDGTLPADSAIAQWGPLFVGGGEKIGRSFTIVDDNIQVTAMKEAGFVDIQEKWIKVPSGGWPADPKLKEIGEFAQHAVLSDVESFILYLTNVHNWSKEEVTVYIAKLRKELKSLKHHVYYWQRVVYGKKPEAT